MASRNLMMGTAGSHIMHGALADRGLKMPLRLGVPAADPSWEPFYNRGFAFEAPVFQYGGFEVVELNEASAAELHRWHGRHPSSPHACKRMRVYRCARVAGVPPGGRVLQVAAGGHP